MKTTEYVLDNSKDKFSFLVVNDTHFNATSPKNRKDDLSETSLLKYEEVIDLSIERKVDFIAHGGDVFHRPDVTDKYAGRVARISRKRKVPIIAIAGGHDLHGNNIDTLERTKLGLSKNSGVIDEILIHPEQDCIIIKNDSLSVQVTGTSSYFGIDHDHIEEDYVLKYKNADFAIHMVHGMLMPTPFIPGAPTVLINDIAHTMADLTLAGHYHIGFTPVELNGKWFANCGAMVRRKNDIKEMARKPQVAIITVSKAKGIEIEYIDLKTARPGDEVLDRTEIMNRQAKQQQAQAFIGQIQSTKKMQSLDISTIIQAISNSRKFPKSVIKEAMDKIAYVKTALDADKSIPVYHSAATDKYLIKLVIKNFQSYESVEVNLSEGINVLLGASDKGKSAFIRAIKWLFYNEPQGSDFVRWGTKECYVTGIFSDGYEVTRGRKSKKNIYIVKKPTGEELCFENFGSNIPAEVIDATGVYKLQIDSDKNLALNLSEQLDPPFLISETGTVRAKAVGSIVKTNILDAAEREAQKDILSVNSDIRNLNIQLKENEEELLKYDGIQEQEEALEKMGKLIGELQNKNKAYEKLKALNENLSKTVADIKKDTSLLDSLSQLQHMEYEVASLELLVSKFDRLNGLKRKKEQKVSEIAAANQMLQSLKNTDDMDELVSRLDKKFVVEASLKKKVDSFTSIQADISKQKVLIQKLGRTDELEQKYHELCAKMDVGETLAFKRKLLDSVNNKITKETAVVESMKSLDIFEAKVTRLADMKEKNIKLSPLNFKLTDTVERINKGIKYVSENEAALESSIDVYVDALGKIGKCPTCTHPIDKAEIQKIAAELRN